MVRGELSSPSWSSERSLASQHLARSSWKADFFGGWHLHVLKLFQQHCWFWSVSRQGARCSGSHQPSREVTLHQMPPVPAPQLKHTFVIHGKATLAISLALQNQKLSQACSLNPAPGSQGIPQEGESVRAMNRVLQKTALIREIKASKGANSNFLCSVETGAYNSNI